MKYYLILITIILVIFFVVFAFLKNNSDDLVLAEFSGEQEFEIKTFEDQTAGYGIVYPGNWSLEDHTFKNELIRADLYYSEEAGIQIRLENRENYSEKEYAQAYLNQYIKDMRSHWPGDIWLESSEQKVLGCCEAYVYNIIHKRENSGRWLLRNYLWFKEDRAVIFQGGMISAKENEFKEEFDLIVNSFRFIR